MIPKIVHRQWHSGNPDDISVGYPPQWWYDSWQRYCPNYDYILWPFDYRDLIRKHAPWFETIFDNYGWYIQRVDAARYFLLYEYGGLYTDLDVECNRNLDEFFKEDERKLILTMEQPGNLISNAVIFCEPRHPFWEYVWHYMVKAKDATVVYSTGPGMLTHAFYHYSLNNPNQIRFLEPNVFHPFDSLDFDRWVKPIPETSAGCHWFAGKWHCHFTEWLHDTKDSPSSVDNRTHT